MIKTVLFDVDGLLLEPRAKFFSMRYAEEHGVAPEAIQEFFMGPFKESSFGRADLKVILAPYLLKWGWQGTIEEFLTYWFETESTRVEEALAYVDRLRTLGIRCYIATRQEKYRMEYLLDVVGLRKHFDGYFCTCDIGYDKKTKEFYNYILEKIKVPADEVLFFDDTEANVEAAKSVGIEAYFYDGLDVLKRHLDPLLILNNK